MKILCEQPHFLTVHARLAKEVREFNFDGTVFLLGVTGALADLNGSDILPFKQSMQKTQGIALYLHDTNFKSDTAAELPEAVKYFIDGVEKVLGRHVLIVGCPLDRQRTAEHWILNENRWPERKAENLGETILNAETEDH